jgi:hypothetical protein
LVVVAEHLLILGQWFESHNKLSIFFKMNEFIY